jgi:two-component system, NtrC family, sensor histidine kinase GlrK
MKIATKITAGFAVLIALMVAVLSYQLLMLERLSVTNSDLSRVYSRALLTTLELLRIRDQVEESTQKYFLLRDLRFRRQLADFQQEFSRKLQEIKTLGSSEAERDSIAQLSHNWELFCAAVTRNEQLKFQEAYDDLPVEIAQSLEQLRVGGEATFQATRKTMESAVLSSTRMSQWADVVSWSAAATALLISCLVSFFVVRSIAEPLNRLTTGTRAIAAGRFSFRLDSSRRDEFAQLADDFNRMSARLSELDQLKKDFVSHISHELKTPLASMREVINLLLTEIPGPLNEKQHRFLQLGARNGERLSEMLSNLLDLSRMEAGVMEYELKESNLAALAQAVKEEFEPQAQEKKVAIKAEIPAAPLPVECDGDRILQVLRNLLDNALKFSPAEADIILRLWWEPRVPDIVPNSYGKQLSESGSTDGFAVLSVADSGPGIAEEDRERIFEKFHRLRKGAKVAGQGTGLGLAISRTIVRAHGGAIWVENNPGGGCIFHVVLPVGSGQGKIRRRISTPV